MDNCRFKALLVCTSLVLSLWGFLVFPVCAEKAGTISKSVLYNCQKQAAEYTYNLDKPGDENIFNKHVRECLAAHKKVSLQDPPADEDKCKPITFKNMSDEDIFVGIWYGGTEVNPTKKGYKAPDDFADWKLPKGESRNWCIPQGFSGRIIARTGCDSKTGKCRAGDCCKDPKGGGDCMHNVCTAGNDSGSVAEFTLDNWSKDDKTGQPLPFATWYDPSYVDGYNFPIKIEFETDQAGQCKALGCTTLPRCPWNGELVDGVCLSPYKKYELEYPDYMKQQAYYVLAAKCAQSDAKICGCGDQCKRKDPTVGACPNEYKVTRDASAPIKSAGCSPLAAKKHVYDNIPPVSGNFVDELAQAQVVCASPADGLSADGKKQYCKFLWDDYDKNAVNYVKAIQPSCPDAYTWQYDDHSGLQSCPTSAIKRIIVTYSQRAKGTNLNGLRLAQKPTISGNVKVSNKADAKYGYSLNFSGKKPDDLPGLEPIVKIKVKNGDTVTITDDCETPGNSRTCVMTYDETVGLIPEGTIINTGKKDPEHGLGVFVPDPKNPSMAKEICYQDNRGYNWAEQTPIYLPLDAAKNTCVGPSKTFSLTQTVGYNKYTAVIKVNNGTTIVMDQSKNPPPPGTVNIPTASFNVQEGDTVVIDDNGGTGGMAKKIARSCSMVYDPKFKGDTGTTLGGLIPKGTKLNENGKIVPIPDDPAALKARQDCYSDNIDNLYCTGFDFKNQDNWTLKMIKPVDTDKCALNYTLSPQENWTFAKYQVNKNDFKDCGRGFSDNDKPMVLKEGDTLTLMLGCGGNQGNPPTTWLTCTMTYDKDKGLQRPSDPVCGAPENKLIWWNDPKDKSKPNPDLKTKLSFGKYLGGEGCR